MQKKAATGVINETSSNPVRVKATEPNPAPVEAAKTGKVSLWSQGPCPNCGYPSADVDPEGILWCPACGYSKKGCYT